MANLLDDWDGQYNTLPPEAKMLLAAGYEVGYSQAVDGIQQGWRPGGDAFAAVVRRILTPSALPAKAGLTQ